MQLATLRAKHAALGAVLTERSRRVWAATEARLRLWKSELQQFANRTGLAITGCHFPPGTSKWNRIEHRLFSHIAMNWGGTPLVDLATIASGIVSTHSRSGPRVRSELDRGRYPGGVAVTDAQVTRAQLERHRFHRAWNYVNQSFPDKP